LENAGNRGDTEFIADNTEGFAGVLEALIQSLKPTETVNESNVIEDTAFLTEQLLLIKTACENYDDAAVYEAIDILKTKPLKPETATMLEKIRDKIYFNTDFDGAAARVDTFLVEIPEGRVL